MTVGIQDLSGLPLYFTISQKTKMQKLFAAYCKRAQINPDSIRFFLEGERVDDLATPETLGLPTVIHLDTFLTSTSAWQTAGC
jgi:hypothetical protein